MMIFFLATSIGKLPALLVEAYSVTQVLKASDDIRIVLILLILVISAVYYLNRNKKKEGSKNLHYFLVN